MCVLSSAGELTFGEVLAYSLEMGEWRDISTHSTTRMAPEYAYQPARVETWADFDGQLQSWEAGLTRSILDSLASPASRIPPPSSSVPC